MWSEYRYGEYPEGWFPLQFESRAAWVEFWRGGHCTAYHGGHPDDCDHCLELISTYGPMPLAEEVEAADLRYFAELRRSRYSKKRIPQSVRVAVFERDAYRCMHCGDWHGLTVDHIHPERFGGTLTLENLQTLCKSCNSRKGTRLA